MKINFTEYSQLKGQGKFHIRIDHTTPEEARENVLTEFKKDHNEMLEDYVGMNEQINELIRRKKILLAKIKHTFDEFQTDRFPEYNL